MRLGVVIVTHNRLNLLQECVNACLSQTIKFSKIVIVDNASTDGTRGYLKSVNGINGVFLKNNIGGAGGFYEGLKSLSLGELDYVLFIDDDAILEKKYNEKISPFLTGEQDAFSGTVLTDGNIQYEHRRFLSENFGQRNSTKENYVGRFFDYDLATFCGLYVSTKLIEKIGLPRKDFFIWFDDTEYSIRISRFCKIRNINDAKLNHKTVLSQELGYSWKSYYSIRNQYVVIKAYFPRELLKYRLKCYLRIIGGVVLAIVKRDKYYKNVSNMYKDAIFDAKYGRMGINKKYVFGYDLRGKDEDSICRR
ncbi:MAG: glycosyltransferase [Candidatus Saccharibacteria bacterium]|nr:glycosyltransferase [Candidatus Saccharibacteria bacterium]